MGVEIPEAEIARLLEDLDRGRDAWIHGRLEETAQSVTSQAANMSIYGPFGGRLVTNGPEFALRQPALAALFRGGAGHLELEKVMSCGDLAVLVLLEHNEVLFKGRSQPQRWTLRTTQVFRRDGKRWIRLHRHADPLLSRRSLDETLAIAAS